MRTHCQWLGTEWPESNSRSLPGLRLYFFVAAVAASPAATGSGPKARPRERIQQLVSEDPRYRIGDDSSRRPCQGRTCFVPTVSGSVRPAILANPPRPISAPPLSAKAACSLRGERIIAAPRATEEVTQLMLLPDSQRSAWGLMRQGIAPPSWTEQRESEASLGIRVQSEANPGVPAVVSSHGPRSSVPPSQRPDVSGRSECDEPICGEVGDPFPVIPIERHLRQTPLARSRLGVLGTDVSLSEHLRRDPADI